MFVDTHYQYHSKLENSQQIEDGDWFDEVDQNIFTFKHFVHNYFQYNDENRSRKNRLMAEACYLKQKKFKNSP